MCIAKDLVGRPAQGWVRIELGVSTSRFLGPEPPVLIRRERVQALQQDLGEARAFPDGPLQRCSFQIDEVHGGNVLVDTSAAQAGTSLPMVQTPGGARGPRHGRRGCDASGDGGGESAPSARDVALTPASGEGSMRMTRSAKRLGSDAPEVSGEGSSRMPKIWRREPTEDQWMRWRATGP